MAPRSQPHRVTWPLTAEQADNIDQMFQMLFDDVRNGSIKIALSEINKAVVNPSTLFHIGDIPYADTTSHLTPLADVATGNAVISGGLDLAPSWGKIGLTTHVSGILPIANGGTNASSQTTNGVTYFDGTQVTSGAELSFVAHILNVNNASGAIKISGGTNPYIQFNNGTNDYYLQVNAGNFEFYTASGTALVISPNGVESARFGGGGGQLQLGNAGGSGALALKGKTSGIVDILVADAAGSWNFQIPTTGGTDKYLLQTNGSGVSTWAQASLTAGVTGVLPIANGGTNTNAQTNTGVAYFDNTKITTAAGFTFDGTNVVTIGTDPGGTDNLRVGGKLTISDTKILTTKTAFTDGAGASTGTLTNAPAATNPTKWIPINDNGTTRYIPAW